MKTTTQRRETFLGKREKELDLKVEAIIAGHEIHVLINGQKYIYFIDGAHIPGFKTLYKYAPGKALQFLKDKSTHFWEVLCSQSGSNGKRTQP
jgi:hypothetical protein